MKVVLKVCALLLSLVHTSGGLTSDTVPDIKLASITQRRIAKDISHADVTLRELGLCEWPRLLKHRLVLQPDVHSGFEVSPSAAYDLSVYSPRLFLARSM